MFRVELTGGSELRRISAQLRAMNGHRFNFIIQTRLRYRMRPLRRQVQARIMGIPATSGYHSGLRLRLVNCLQVADGSDGHQAWVDLYMDVYRMPSGQFALPAAMEGLKRWRHPVFGDRAVWVTQSAHPYFYPAVATAGPGTRAAIDAGLDQITTDVSGR